MTVAFGRSADEVFSYISPRPVAAASLGQVYKAQLRPQYGSGEVAVKVQRPGVLEQVRPPAWFRCVVAATSSNATPGYSASMAGLPDDNADHRSAQTCGVDICGLVLLLQVCLDLYLMRQVAASISAMPDVTTDWPALIDTWAVRFLHEMDYTREAANAQLFR